MKRRTTIELDDGLLARAKKALGGKTTRGTIEEALRLAADAAEKNDEEIARRRLDYLKGLSSRVDIAVLKSEEMWR